MKRFYFLLLVLVAGCGPSSVVSPFSKAKAAPVFKRCRDYTHDDCKKSLRSAVEVATKCPFSRRTRKCLMTFVETLHEADEKAPFYSAVFNKQFELGDVEAYKRDYWKLSRRTRNTIKDLSAFVGMQVESILKRRRRLSKDMAHELHDAIELRFERYAQKPYKEARPKDIKEFQQAVKMAGHHIQWPEGIV